MAAKSWANLSDCSPILRSRQSRLLKVHQMSVSLYASRKPNTPVLELLRMRNCGNKLLLSLTGYKGKAGVLTAIWPARPMPRVPCLRCLPFYGQSDSLFCKEKERTSDAAPEGKDQDQEASSFLR